MISKIAWKKALFLLVILFAMVAGFTACGFLNKTDVAAKQNAQPALQVNTPEKKDSKRINILILGVDDGDPESPGSPRRSDTMMVASINPDDNTVNILSIPRDSKVAIPGHFGYDKITHAFFYGGANLSVRTVEDNFHIPLNYSIVIDWKAFIKVVDILGGVDIKVERDMNYEDPYENLSIHLQKGYQHLNGERAGEYVRFRHDELGDIGRVQRQDSFIKALTGQLLQTGTILKLPALITTISQYVQTDMNTYTLVKIANILKNLHTDAIHTEMLPGDFATIDDVSYWIPDREATQQIVESKFK
ncbi:MAG: LCP family protein [Pelosinus sp.]|nr:LCP family protein [Pelosinus sp.]